MKKYWAKPDKLLDNEMKAEDAPIDDFKVGRKIKLKNNLVKDLNWDKPNSKPVPISLDNSSNKPK